jgi:Trk-type K+ transport system membrane component
MGAYLLIPTFVVIIVSIMVVRAGAIALRMTGLDEKTARFQALSAFSRAGFTTRESESVVGHPQRRTIITWLIVLGNAGIVAVIVTGTSSLATSKDYRLAIYFAVLVIGVYIVYRLAKHTGFARRWENLVENRLLRGKFFTSIPPVEHLLHLAGGYGIAQATITEESPLAGSSFRDIGVTTVDFTVLGIERRGQWISSPSLDESISEGDALVLYGRLDEIEQILGRKRAAKD